MHITCTVPLSQLRRRFQKQYDSSGPSYSFFPTFYRRTIYMRRKRKNNYPPWKVGQLHHPRGNKNPEPAHSVNQCLASGLAKGGCNGRSGFRLNSFKRSCRSVNFSCSCAPYFLYWPSEKWHPQSVELLKNVLLKATLTWKFHRINHP